MRPTNTILKPECMRVARVCVCACEICGVGEGVGDRRMEKKRSKYINKRNLYADKGDDDQEENEVKSLSALLKQPSASSA